MPNIAKHFSINLPGCCQAFNPSYAVLPVVIGVYLFAVIISLIIRGMKIITPKPAGDGKRGILQPNRDDSIRKMGQPGG